ncbi:MAG: hypothetical protein QM733_00755 [Ilumatobacteraceae bacterium]
MSLTIASTTGAEIAGLRPRPSAISGYRADRRAVGQPQQRLA